MARIVAMLSGENLRYVCKCYIIIIDIIFCHDHKYTKIKHVYGHDWLMSLTSFTILTADGYMPGMAYLDIPQQIQLVVEHTEQSAWNTKIIYKLESWDG